MLAAEGGYIRWVERFLDVGADPRKIDNKGNTALDLAIAAGNSSEYLEELLGGIRGSAKKEIKHEESKNTGQKLVVESITTGEKPAAYSDVKEEPKLVQDNDSEIKSAPAPVPEKAESNKNIEKPIIEKKSENNSKREYNYVPEKRSMDLAERIIRKLIPLPPGSMDE
jgi:ankyrin repeat protein